MLQCAVFVSSGAIKNAVTSIWEAEVNAASDAVDTILYAGNVDRELRYPVGEIGKVMVDNESAIAWLGGANVSTTTKHGSKRRGVLSRGQLVCMSACKLRGVLEKRGFA
jgi:hypothetical protein